MIPQLPNHLSKLAKSSPPEFSATNPDHQEFVQQAAVSILEDHITATPLQGLLKAL